MAITLDRFAQYRPYVFHLTSETNIEHIRTTWQLSSAADLLVAAGKPDWLRQKRENTLRLDIRGTSVELRDHAPLNMKNILLDEGWELGDLIESLNKRVFFWPGTAAGPDGKYGQNHFNRYQNESESLRILRIPFEALLEINRPNEPEFCRYNSGASRRHNGNRIPRGRNTFTPASLFEGGISDVVEVTFVGTIRLPHEIEVAGSYGGDWERERRA